MAHAKNDVSIITEHVQMSSFDHFESFDLEKISKLAKYFKSKF